ncbi:hypothetical protein EVAR_40762_1 [Eumeta japonica]|uniref:Uncharacterized protein n=1 Tax=Eumeta variegata TaxID=151549 RepID=A0A4C1X3D9_EUMVA|nr:hypothetical protein EVAR_40762_1 [Eumeta japonica]
MSGRVGAVPLVFGHRGRAPFSSPRLSSVVACTAFRRVAITEYSCWIGQGQRGRALCATCERCGGGCHAREPRRRRASNFDVKDEPRSGRPVTDEVNAILGKVEQDHHISSYDKAEAPGIDHKKSFDPFEKWNTLPKKLVIEVAVSEKNSLQHALKNVVLTTLATADDLLRYRDPVSRCQSGRETSHELRIAAVGREFAPKLQPERGAEFEFVTWRRDPTTAPAPPVWLSIY